MSYITSQSKQVAELMEALGINCQGVRSFHLSVKPGELVRLEIERYVTDNEAAELTNWILKNNIKVEQLGDG